MKEIKTERKIYDISYEAVDGTVFYNKEECKKYDGTARAIVRSNFKKLVIKEGDEYSFFGVGDCEATLYAVKMDVQTDANTVKQLWELDHSYLNSSSNYNEFQKEAFDKIDQALCESDILFVGEDCEGCSYIIGTRNNIIKNLQNIDKKQDDTEGQSKG